MDVPERMTAVRVTAHGGPEVLQVAQVPVPVPARGEVLVQVRAVALNNTDLWTRQGAYGLPGDPDALAGWRGPIEFPRIQGADVAVIVASVGPGSGYAQSRTRRCDRIRTVWGKLRTEPVQSRLDLVADPVADGLAAWHAAPDEVLVAPIDPDLADTAAFCQAYDISLDASANCVVVAGKRGGDVRYAACVVLATTRVDVNNVVRRHLDVRKASFAPTDDAVARTGMEYGGITPIGLPGDWPILIDARVADTPYVVIGSGVRHSKIVLPGGSLARLPGAVVLDGLAHPVDR